MSRPGRVPRISKMPKATDTRLDEGKLDKERRTILARLRAFLPGRKTSSALDGIDLSPNTGTKLEGKNPVDHYIEALSAPMPLMTLMTFTRLRKFVSGLFGQSETATEAAQPATQTKRDLDLGTLTINPDGTNTFFIGRGEMLAKRAPFLEDEVELATLRKHRSTLQTIHRLLTTEKDQSYSAAFLRDLFNKWDKTHSFLTNLITDESSSLIYETLNIVLVEADTIYFVLHGMISEAEGETSNMTCTESQSFRQNLGTLDMDAVSLLVGLKPIDQVTFDVKTILDRLETYYSYVMKAKLKLDGVHTGYPGLFLFILKGFMQNAAENHRNYDGVPLEVSAQLTDTSLILRDNGRGFSEAELPHIFESKKDPGDTSYHGTGLELMFRAVALYGGSIEVTSKKGEFTEYRVTLDSD